MDERGEVVVRSRDILAALGGPRQGRRVAVALIDSGVLPGHPLVGAVAEAVAIRDDASPKAAVAEAAGDALGHGTACAMVISAYCPPVRIHSIRVFEERLAAPLRVLERALDYAVARGVDLVNLSAQVIGDQQGWWDEVCARAGRQGIVVVRSAGGDGVRMDGPNVFTVQASEACRWGELLIARGPASGLMACPYAVHLPGVDRSDDFHGASVATAHVTGILAAVLERATAERLKGVLRAAAAGRGGGPRLHLAQPVHSAEARLR